MQKPFRFGVQISSLKPGKWVKKARRFEELGYDTLFCPDHFGGQWDPTALLASVAAVTERIRIGTLVHAVDFRHPAVLAKSAATLQLLSGGRFEFGIGAGWQQSDYEKSGIGLDPPGVRIERLGEALEIIRSMWTLEQTSFEGAHYRIAEIGEAVSGIREVAPPRVLIGGGGRKLLALAGRHADIVGINPQLHEGAVTAETPGDLTPERVREKIRWIRESAEAAGRDPETIELSSLSFVVSITDDPKPVREALAKGTGMSVEQVSDCPLFLIGSSAELCDRLQKRREETGISYVVIQGGGKEVIEGFAEAVIEPLSEK